MWRRRRERNQQRARVESETRAALAVATQHAEASYLAQEANAAVPVDIVIAEVVPFEAAAPVSTPATAPADASTTGPATDAVAPEELAPDELAPDELAPGIGIEPVVGDAVDVAATEAETTMHHELVRVLGAVTTMCDHVIEYIEADRAERRVMLEALTRLTRALEAPPASRRVDTSNGERLLGGSVPSGPTPPRATPDNAEDEYVIDLTAEADADRETMVEVRGRFGDRWVDGFEICETVPDGRSVRYRLRRILDGAVLPELFDAADIRHVETFDELTSTPQQQRYWSPL